MCYIRNPIHLLSYMKLFIPPEDLREIIAITLANMKRLLRADGASPVSWPTRQQRLTWLR